MTTTDHGPRTTDQKSPLVTTYLEMRSPDQLQPKRADAQFQVREKTERDWRFKRDLYFRVGEQWHWIDKRPWTAEQWKEYAALPQLRTMRAAVLLLSVLQATTGALES